MVLDVGISAPVSGSRGDQAIPVQNHALPKTRNTSGIGLDRTNLIQKSVSVIVEKLSTVNHGKSLGIIPPPRERFRLSVDMYKYLLEPYMYHPVERDNNVNPRPGFKSAPDSGIPGRPSVGKDALARH